MLGRRSGVGIRLKNDFPDIILWHCLNQGSGTYGSRAKCGSFDNGIWLFC